MSDIRITFTGTSPLMVHNPRLSDPDDPIVKEIKAITSKRVKTEDDRRAIEKLEWYGGLYTDPTIPGPVMPTASIRRCLIGAAKQTRHGKNVERAISFRQLSVPIVYEGSRDIDQLWQDESHRFRLSVVVQRARTWRMRPGWHQWAVSADAFLLDELMDVDVLTRILERAGASEGLAENRVNGYGRFAGTVKVVSA